MSKKRASGSNIWIVGIFLANFSLKRGHLEDNAEKKSLR
jgi:hypothetical protein